MREKQEYILKQVKGQGIEEFYKRKKIEKKTEKKEQVRGIEVEE